MSEIVDATSINGTDSETVGLDTDCNRINTRDRHVCRGHNGLQEEGLILDLNPDLRNGGKCEVARLMLHPSMATAACTHDST